MSVDHPHTPTLRSNENLILGELSSKVALVGGIVGIGLLALSAVIGMMGGGEHAWERFFRAYLAAFVFVVSLSLGSLFFVFIQFLTRAGWSVAVRRVFEAVMINLTWIWILFIPIAVIMIKIRLTGHGVHLYEWADPAVMDPASSHFDELLHKKKGFLNIDFWLIRAGAYFLLWAVIARFYFRNSVAQDASGDPELTSRMQSLSAPVAIIYMVTQTFAIVDWVMTLEPHWFSTMIGVYYFAGSCCGAGALAIILTYLLQRAGRATQSITTEHYQEMGKFLFAFGIVFWAYIAFGQFMLIWYGNVPEETAWYMPRQLGGWGAVSLLLLVGHFVGPFLAIMSRHTKRNRGTLAASAVWMLLMHFIDIYWLVMPRVPAAHLKQAADYSELSQMISSIPAGEPSPIGYGWHILDLTCLLGMLALFVAATAYRMRNVSLVPLRDPRLDESLAFENM